jgi:hypothetical protein
MTSDTDRRRRPSVIESAPHARDLSAPGRPGRSVVGCRCRVCTSTHPRNQRLRQSVDRGAEALLIDTTPDLRLQPSADPAPQPALHALTLRSPDGPRRHPPFNSASARRFAHTRRADREGDPPRVFVHLGPLQIGGGSRSSSSEIDGRLRMTTSRSFRSRRARQLTISGFASAHSRTSGYERHRRNR